jgi:GT2 family glycosyltransferase
MSTDLVAAVIAVRNGAEFIGRAIDSVLDQTVPVELVVVDDGSTDHTREIVARYGARVASIATPPLGRSAARNLGIERSGREWIAFLDADDEWLPTKVERQLALSTGNDSCVLVYCSASYIDSHSNRTVHAGRALSGLDRTGHMFRDHRRDLLRGNTVTLSTAMVRREALTRVGGFDTRLEYAEDIDLWYRLSALGPFGYLDEPLVRYRVYGWPKELEAWADADNLRQQVLRLAKARADGSEADAVYNEAEAHIHCRAAMAALQLGDVGAARAILQRAVELDPELREPEAMGRVLEAHARRMRRAGETVQAITCFLEAALESVPASPAADVPALLSRMELRDASRAYSRRPRGPVREHLRAALAHDPRSIGKTSVWRMWLGSWRP